MVEGGLTSPVYRERKLAHFQRDRVARDLTKGQEIIRATW